MFNFLFSIFFPKKNFHVVYCPLGRKPKVVYRSNSIIAAHTYIKNQGGIYSSQGVFGSTNGTYILECNNKDCEDIYNRFIELLDDK